MGPQTGEEPPDPSDLAGWQRAIVEQRLHEFPAERIVAAFQDLGPNTDKSVRHALAKYLSDDIYTRLRRNIGRNHPNEGWDIVDRAHFQLCEALARPQSADGKGMREAYVSRVMFRMKDAIATEARARRVPDELPAVAPSKKSGKLQRPANDDGEAVTFVETQKHPDLTAEEVESSDDEEARSLNNQVDLSLLDGVRDLDEQIDVDRFLQENITDDRKRLAFRLFMDDLPYKSNKSNSISKALGVDEKTARGWIQEIQQNLKLQLGEKPKVKMGDKT
jgi:hypothetical protein